MKICPFCLGKVKDETTACCYCDSKLVGELEDPQLAAFRSRFLAAVVDLLVTAFGPVLATFLASYFMWAFTAMFTWHRLDIYQILEPLIDISAGLGLISGVLLVVFYQIKWVYKDGQTIGKKALRIRIVGCKDLKKVGFLRHFLWRFFLGVGPVLALGFYLPYFLLPYFVLNLILFSRKKRRFVHDFLAKTRVIQILKHASPLKGKLKGSGHLKVNRKFINRFRK